MPVAKQITGGVNLPKSIPQDKIGTQRYRTWCSARKKDGNVCSMFKWFDEPGMVFICGRHRRFWNTEPK